MRKTTIAGAALALGLGAATAALAQTASPANRDTTVQTGGPSGTSGAVGPNDRPDGSDKDGTRPNTPAASATTPGHHHRHISRPVSATPPPGQG
jgi:hypothetical protein